MQHVRLAICLLVLAFACLVWARKDVIDIRSDAIVELVLPFGAQNGSVSLELHCTDVGQVSQSVSSIHALHSKSNYSIVVRVPCGHF